MLQDSADARQLLEEGRSIMGHGWKEVESFDDLDDADEYESEEEEVYVVMDLGGAIEPKTLMTENSYQLIGLETPMPFLKLGNQVYQGERTTLIGDEVILGLIRNDDDPHNPSRPPIHATSHRLIFRPVSLEPKHTPTQLAARDASRPPAAAPARPTAPLGTTVFSAAGPSRPAYTYENVPVQSKYRHTIQTLEQLVAIDLRNTPQHHRFELSSELQLQFGMEDPPAGFKGYSKREIRCLQEGRPISGKGSRALPPKRAPASSDATTSRSPSVAVARPAPKLTTKPTRERVEVETPTGKFVFATIGGSPKAKSRSGMADVLTTRSTESGVGDLGPTDQPERDQNGDAAVAPQIAGEVGEGDEDDDMYFEEEEEPLRDVTQMDLDDP